MRGGSAQAGSHSIILSGVTTFDGSGPSGFIVTSFGFGGSGAVGGSAAGGGDATGNFTLILRKGAAGWKIIHDHTS